MSYMHEIEIRGILGDSYRQRDWSHTMEVDVWDYENMTTGAIENRSGTRRLIVIEGEVDKIRHILDALARADSDAVSPSLRQRFLCPFCPDVIIEVAWPSYPIVEVEGALRLHLLEKHPVRWRLSRRFRRAMKVLVASPSP